MGTEHSFRGHGHVLAVLARPSSDPGNTTTPDSSCDAAVVGRPNAQGAHVVVDVAVDAVGAAEWAFLAVIVVPQE